MRQLLLFSLFSFLIPYSANAETIEQNDWKIELSDTNGSANIYKNNVLLIANNYGRFKIDNTTFDCTSLTLTEIQVQGDYSDIFGSGKKVTIQYQNTNPTLTVLHSYYLYSDQSYILTDLSITSGAVMASNYMAPFYSTTSSTFLPASKNYAMLVPYDNDAWVRFESKDFGSTITSYEVGCLFNKEERTGLVVGSIDHSEWKTGVKYTTGTSNELNFLEAFGGVANKSYTRDNLPHGKIKGKAISSPRMLLGLFEDWRTGMETYADANAIVAPKLPWKGGTPFGWNSWGNLMDRLSYTAANGTSLFMANYLQPEFSNDTTIYFGLDSYWDNLSKANLERLIKNCKSRGQQVGIYWTPFVDWSGDPAREVEGTNGMYTYGDIHLKANGQRQAIAGGYAVDPTHPATKMRIDHFVNQFKELGYKFIKIDFMVHGALEADSHYDHNVTTGVQAYNQGMDYFVKACEGTMYINLSIAPLFPAHYAHGRRISCDTYGAMSESQYELNSLTHGWWLDRVYSYNDADYMVFGKFSNNYTTYSNYSINENRIRISSVVTTGIYLFGDDFYSCNQTTKDRAIEMAKKQEINQIARIGRSFKPVEGGWGNQPADLYMNWNKDTLYLAAYNFSGSPKTFHIEMDRVGLTQGTNYIVHELWMNDKTEIKESLSFRVVRMDVRIYKIYPGTLSAIQTPSASRISVYPNPCTDQLIVSSLDHVITSYDIYSTLGVKMLSFDEQSGGQLNLQSLPKGSYLLLCKDDLSQQKYTYQFVKQ